MYSESTGVVPTKTPLDPDSRGFRTTPDAVVWWLGPEEIGWPGLVNQPEEEGSEAIERQSVAG
jgi:hypothetical protein